MILYKTVKEKIFIDRTVELTTLVSALTRTGSELIILYGRRRIGKSRLLKEVSNRVNIDILVMLEEADYKTNLNKIARVTSKRYKFPSFNPASFKDIFQAVPAMSLT